MGQTDYLDRLEIREREKLGIDTLKVGYNAVHGYYIQVSRGQSHLTPIHYVRRQTLKMPNAILFLNSKNMKIRY